MSRRLWSRVSFLAGLPAALILGAHSAHPSAQSYAGSPFSGAAVSIPGTIQAAEYDNGGEGIAYLDTTPGNSGGAYRSDDVDIEPDSEGGFDVGWIASGEWLNYSVNVAQSGKYTAQIRLASPYGGSLHIGFNGPSSVWTTVSVPVTGGWQAWQTVAVPVTLGAGNQLLTLAFDTGGFNIGSINVAPARPGGGGSGTALNVATWNIDIDDHTEAHARAVMDTLASLGPPDVVVIQEAYLDWFGVYIDELQNMTGRTWYGQFATHCPAGYWNGSWCDTQWYQGVGIFSTYNIVDTDSIFLPFPDCWTSARAGLRVALDVNGTTVQVFTTHLQTGGCGDDAQARYNSMGVLKAWAGNYSTPQLVAGDFNADADQIDTYEGMLPNFADAWLIVGDGLGFSAYSPSPTMRLDYWFSDVSGGLLPVYEAVVTWADDISDHFPLQATFVIQ
jgi:endonuclease/exonuclease/phosphatase family metal-dependent hydrolase